MSQRITGLPIYATLIAALALLLAGCGNMGGLSEGGGHKITIASDPAGATVLADGVEIGATPLTFSPSDAFRSGFTGGSGSGLLVYRYYGKLALKKAGCKDYVTEVNDNLLSGDIQVKLECDPDYRPPAPPAAPPPASAPAQQPDMPASAEQRLMRIESLHEKGLISDEEYRQLRQRILDTL